MDEVINSYKKLKDKYRLPEYDELDREFLIGDIEKKDYLLERIRKLIEEKIRSMIDILENILQPDSNLINIYEYKFIDDGKKQEVYKIFKKFVMYLRLCEEASILKQEQKTAEFISKFYSDYSHLKKETVSIVRLLKESWEKESNIKEELNYLG
ncbi:hypothetical protein GF327_02025 [Candidatus Woesearchaeota archaeon]|nr:hypothetical protein [Candidatus Woesearchaeota archaeon]